MPTNISPADAKIMIDRYRATMQQTDLNCALFNDDFIKFLKEHSEKLNISGIRVYMAKDDKGTTTVILAATTNVNGKEEDIKTGYYDFSNPCPTNCGLGEI